jgi:NAD(P)-dependent dehydrogenase (short-subunit alcohol dehydrogenase family)
MPTLSAIRAANAAAFPPHSPIAVFVGGTSGIGQSMVEAFGRLTKGNGQIIIVGRNRTAADSIIAKLPQSSRTPPHKFFQCDATLMKNVHAASSEILANHPKINFLVMSPGFMTTKGRDETEEGIDRKLAVHYYARWAFINDLMPALQKASEDGEEAKVFSVLGAGKGAEIDVEDLGLKKTYSVRNAGLAAPTYNDLMMEVR